MDEEWSLRPPHRTSGGCMAFAPGPEGMLVPRRFGWSHTGIDWYNGSGPNWQKGDGSSDYSIIYYMHFRPRKLRCTSWMHVPQ